MQNRYILIYIIVLLLNSCTTTYYIVRHAERECGNCATCGLTDAGKARAIALKDKLIDKGIDSIFVSECLRTQLTAQPLADQLNEPLSIYQTSDLPSLITTLKSTASQKQILITGHSDQVPVIIDSLTHVTIPVINDTDYDNFYTVRRKKCFKVRYRLEVGMYGVLTP